MLVISTRLLVTAVIALVKGWPLAHRHDSVGKGREVRGGGDGARVSTSQIDLWVLSSPGNRVSEPVEMGSVWVWSFRVLRILMF